MQTVSPPTDNPTNRPPTPSRPRPKSTARPRPRPARPVSYAPVVLAALLVIGFFVALSFVIATDDVAGLVETLSLVGWIVAGLGLVLALGVLIRRGKPVLGLGIISASVLLVAGIVVVLNAPGFTGPAHYSQGQQAFAVQNYDRAITEYRLAGNPDYFHKDIPEAYFKWGDQLAKSGNYDKALAQYDKVSSPELQPNSLEAQLPDARARVWLAWAEKLDKDNARAWATLPDSQKQSLESDLLAKYDAALHQNPLPSLANPAKSGARNVLYRQAEELKTQNRFEELDNIYQKVSTAYLDGKPPTVSELENRRANNYFEWSRQLGQAGDYEGALSQLQKAESRLTTYDQRRLDTLYPEIATDYSKLAPQLVSDGKYDAAVSRLEAALKNYGSHDARNLIAQALLNSYVAYGSDLKDRAVLGDARDKYKRAYDLNNTYVFKDNRPKAGLAGVYLAQGQEAEQKADFPGAIAIYREGLKAQYFSQAETISATTGVSRTYFSWAQGAEGSNDLDKALGIYRDGLTSGGFDNGTKAQATDAGGAIFLKRGATAEQNQDLQGAVNVYAALAADVQFKTSAASKNLVNVAPKVIFGLSDKLIKEAGTGDSLDRGKLVQARDLLQNLVNTYGASDFANGAKGILTAPVVITGKLLNSKGDPLGNRPMQLSTEVKLCTAALPDDDPDCRGQKEGFVAKGDVKGFNTGPDGGWLATLIPGKTYLVSWQERGGKWTSAFVGNTAQGQPGVVVKVDPMIPIKYEYRTPTEAPQ